MSEPVHNRREPAELTAADAETALERIAARDPDLARDASHVLDTLTWGEGPHALRQAAVQDWLWYRLPTKYLTDEPGYMTRLADTAAVLFDELGLHRYAAICRSDTTRTVHTAYERSDAAGRTAMRNAIASSGVEPPDLDDFAWGDVMGMAELDAHTAVQDALETAIATGHLVVGGRAWRRHHTNIAAAALDAAHPHEPGQTWRTAVITERLHHWVDTAERHHPPLGQLRSDTANRLLHPIGAPPDVDTMMQPITWFLTTFGDQQPLTTAGYLTPALVRQLHSDAPWDDPYSTGRAPRTELDAIIVHKVRSWLQTAGALRKHKNTLRRTPTGAASATDPTAAWQLLVANLGSHPWDRFVIDTCALALLNHPDPVSIRDLTAFTADAAGPMGWVTTEHHQRRPPTERDTSRALHQMLSLLTMCNVVTETGDWRDRRIALTAGGTTTMLAALHTTATGPRTHPG